MTGPLVRLHLYFAREAPLAVILRQGPARQFRMIVWDRSNDSFTDGQWTKNKVYPDRCAISPDGRHFLYFMLDGRWDGAGEGAYTAISRPPYWTALALFPEGNTWGGGGVFLDEAHYLADGGEDVVGRGTGLVRVRWGAVTADCQTGLRLCDGRPAALAAATESRALDLKPGDRPVDLRRAGYDVPENRPLDRYDTRGGRLYRRRGADLDLIRDFSDMTFEPLRAPYDIADG